VFTNTLHQFTVLVFQAFARFALANITITQIRHGTDNRFGFAVFGSEQYHLVRRVVTGGADHMYVQRLEQTGGRIQKAGGIMVAANDHHMTTARARHLVQKAVIEGLRPVTRGGGIEQVAGNQQHLNVQMLDLCQHPVEKSGKFIVTLLAVEQTAQMPVGAVQDSEGFRFNSWGFRLRRRSRLAGQLLRLLWIIKQ
jgi:hypothetical protein